MRWRRWYCVVVFLFDSVFARASLARRQVPGLSDWLGGKANMVTLNQQLHALTRFVSALGVQV